MGDPQVSAALRDTLAALLPGIALQQVDEIDSTNTRLVERARAGDTTPCLLLARNQRAGRGRQGRRWQSQPEASLTFSLALALDLAQWSGLSLAVGVALADALDPLRAGATARIGLKWPNDLLIVDPRGDRKLGGILIETVPAGALRIAVIGVGLNLAPQTDDGFATGCGWLGEVDPALADRQAALGRVASALLRALLAFEREGFAPLRARYAARDRLAGRAVTTTLAAVPAGVARGVDDAGTLWLQVGDRRVAIASGEVSVRAASLAGAPRC